MFMRRELTNHICMVMQLTNDAWLILLRIIRIILVTHMIWGFTVVMNWGSPSGPLPLRFLNIAQMETYKPAVWCGV